MADINAALPVRNGDVALGEDQIQVKTKSGTNLDVNINADAVGLALEAGNLATIAGDTTSIDGKITTCNTGAIAGTVTANAGTNLNTSALAVESGGNLDAIVSSLSAVNSDTTSLDGKLNSLGQKNMAGSVPVVIASDQGSLPITLDTMTADIQYATASVAAAASSTHSYAPVATAYLKKILVSSSGQVKAEIQYGITGAETTKAVAFSSKGNLGSINIDFPDSVEITSTMTVKVIITNTDNTTMSVYSTMFLGA